MRGGGARLRSSARLRPARLPPPEVFLHCCFTPRNAMHLRWSLRFALAFLSLNCALLPHGNAQAPIQPKPQAPNLTAAISPISVQRAATVELTLGGANLAYPLAVW